MEKKWKGEMSAAVMQAVFSILGKASCWGPENKENPAGDARDK